MAEDTELLQYSPVDSEDTEDIFTPNPGHQDWLTRLPGLAEKLKPYEINNVTLIGIPTKILLEYLVEHQTDRPHDLNEVLAIFYNELRQPVPKRSLALYKTVVARRDQLQTTHADTQTLQDTEQTITRYRESIIESFTKVPLMISAIGHFMQQPVVNKLIEDYITEYGQQPKIINNQPTSRTYGQSLSESLHFIKDELNRLTADWTEVSQDDYLSTLNQRN